MLILWRVKDCRVIAEERTTMQHKPHVFVTRMQTRREIMVGGGQDGRRMYMTTQLIYSGNYCK